ncbi:MAG: FlgD immunoglobulin-like domain containing protein [Candidatus Eisenbacteria bacterium]|nr:FlgD immunoglobulin-like domain containing protein [Candidatus Eisenbacteria bacterium]
MSRSVIVILAAIMLSGTLLALSHTPAPASTWDGKAKLLLHVKALTTKSACTYGKLTDARQANTRGDVYSYYHVYLLAARGDSPGVVGVSTGLTYDNGFPSQMYDYSGVDIYGWTNCADLEFVQSGWPAPGSGNLLTWNECQASETVVAGYFYVGIYSAAEMSLTSLPSSSSASVMSCDQSQRPQTVLARANFTNGALPYGCNPALANCTDPPPAPGPPPALVLDYPNGGTNWVVGTIQTVRWSGSARANLYFSGDLGFTWTSVGSNLGGQPSNSFLFPVPNTKNDNALFRIAPYYPTSDSAPDTSDAPFRIVEEKPTPAAACVLSAQRWGVAGDRLGSAMSAAGDVNRDGYSDFVIGAPFADQFMPGSDTGIAWLVLGGPSGDLVPDIEFPSGGGMGMYGAAVTGGGDFNGDGFDDVAVAATGNASVKIHLGAAIPNGFEDFVISQGTLGFGKAIAFVGDMNRDGFDELAIASPDDGMGGRIDIFQGGAVPNGVADLTITGAQAGQGLGSSLSGGHDVNGDGYDDLLVGAPGFDGIAADIGRAVLYFGGITLNSVIDWEFRGAAVSDRLGESVAMVGDTDGDGRSDFVVGAPGSDARTLDGGRGFLFFGGAPPDILPDLTVDGLSSREQLGAAVGGGVDLNGDTCPDFAFASPFLGTIGTGRVTVYFGSTTPRLTAGLLITAASGDGLLGLNHFGSTLAFARNFDGDGFGDILIGAPRGTGPGGADAGDVLLHGTSRYVLMNPNGGDSWNVGARRTVNWLGAEPADVLLSVDAGATWNVLSQAVGGYSSNAIAVTVPHLPTQYAMVQIRPDAATVNGSDQSAAIFAITASVIPMNVQIIPLADGSGRTVRWETDPPVGPEGIAGYRLYRLRGEGDTQGQSIGPSLITETEFVDRDLADWGYRLTAMNHLAEELELARVGTGNAATTLRIAPNPARAGTPISIEFTMPFLANGSRLNDFDVSIFDLNGRLVRNLVRGVVEANRGNVELRWDGLTDSGNSASTGLYFVRASDPYGRFEVRQRLVLVR